MRLARWIIALVGVLTPITSGAQEQSVRIRDAPTAVIQNVSARFPKAKVMGVSKDTEDGQVVFEVSLDQNGRNIDVTTTPNGRITLIEKEIALRDLPRAVTRLIDARYPGSTFQRVEEVFAVAGTSESLSFYEVLLASAKKQLLEIQAAPDGKTILKVEKKTRDGGRQGRARVTSSPVRRI